MLLVIAVLLTGIALWILTAWATALTVYTTDRAAANFTLTGQQVSADPTGNNFVNDGRTMLYIENTSGGTITLTEVIQATVDGQGVTSRTVSILNNTRYILGPFPQSIYNDTNGNMNFTFSAGGLKLLAFTPTQT